MIQPHSINTFKLTFISVTMKRDTQNEHQLLCNTYSYRLYRRHTERDARAQSTVRTTAQC